jgi:hypothetical protein
MGYYLPIVIFLARDVLLIHACLCQLWIRWNWYICSTIGGIHFYIVHLKFVCFYIGCNMLPTAKLKHLYFHASKFPTRFIYTCVIIYFSRTCSSISMFYILVTIWMQIDASLYWENYITNAHVGIYFSRFHVLLMLSHSLSIVIWFHVQCFQRI